MNQFEQDVQSKNNDVVDSVKGFTFSFLFFIIIYVLGAIISLIN